MQLKRQMMAGKPNDPLRHIYEDIADHFKPSHFKYEHTKVGDKPARHQRYQITGFRVLIPVARKLDPEEKNESSVELLKKLFWASELVGHTKSHMDEFDLGDFRARLVRGETPTRFPPRDFNRSPHFTRYSFPQAMKFAKQYSPAVD